MEEKIQEILEAAVAAPSGDNCQPWRFEIEGRLIRVFNLPERDTSLYNFEQKASMAAHGALLENLTIAAKHLGFAPDIRLFPGRGNPDLVAEVELTPAAPEPQPLYGAIAERTTNRRVYSGRPLTEEQKKSLSAAADGIDGVRVWLADDREAIARLAQALSVNDRLVFENENLHKFLFDHLRWSDEEARRTRDGLDIQTFELSGFDAFGFKMMRNWSVVNLLTSFGLGKKIQKQAEKLCLSASAIIAVTVHGASREDFLHGGRGMERVWLEATRLGLACHSVSGLAYLIQRMKAGSTAELSTEHQDVIRQVDAGLQKVFRHGDKNIVMLFRVGAAEEPSARSLRIPPQKMLRAS